jgi:hypothetical protein
LTGRSHDYKRHGTTTLFAAPEVGTGKIIATHPKRPRVAMRSITWRVEALGRQNAELGFHQIEPAAVLWACSALEALDQGPGFGGWEKAS